MADRELTEAEILAKGKLVGGAATGEKAAAPTELTEADILANGKLVQAVSTSSPTSGQPRGFGDELARQAGLTGRMVIKGAGDILDLGGAPINYLLNKGADAVFGANPTPRFMAPSQAMSTIADRIGLPQPENAMERIVQSGGSQLVSTVIPAGVANQVAKTATGATQKVASLLAQNPTAQAVGGFTGGAAGQTATEMGFNPYVSTAANLLGAVLGTGAAARIGNAATGNYTPAGQDAMALNAAAKQKGVTLTAGDLGNRPAQVFENFTQDLPGTGRDAFMRKQATQVKSMLDDFGAKNTSNVEPPKQMIQALRDSYKAAKSTASTLYDDVNRSLARVPGSEYVDVPTFSARAKNFLNEYPKYLDSPDVPESVKTVLRNAKDGNLSAVNYKNGRQISTLIGTEARNAAKAGKTISGELDQLYASLRKDFDGWATNLQKTNPPAASAYGQADSYFKSSVLPFRADSKVRNIVSSKATADELDIAADTIMGALFKSGKPNRADYALKLSGKDGLDAAQRELLDRALSAGLSDRTNAGVSPMRFVNTLNLEDQMTANVMNRPTPLSNNIQDVNDIAQATRRSVGAFETPRTGVQDKALAAVVGLANPGTTLQTAGGLLTGQVGNRLLRTDPVKGLLFADPGNPYMNFFPVLNGLIEPQRGSVGVYDPATGKQINR